jgi:hypothetical protein
MDATQLPEAWRPVVGHEGAYEVSDLGRVRSLDRTITHTNGARTRLKGKLLKPYLSEDNYYRTSLSSHTAVRVHTLVLEAFVGPRPPGMVACHNDGNGGNNHVSNLRWDTYGANNHDLVRHGTHWQVVKTHCPKGHLYNERNTFQRPEGGRRCRKCQREANRRSKAKKKARAAL